MEISEVKRIIEAALLAAGQPLTLVQLSALFGEGEPIATDAVAQAITELQDDCATRGVELVEVASGFRFQVRTDVHPWVARLWTERQTKYSRALLETLALIAYRQPITRAEIEQIRGVAVSSNIIRTLEEREWVRVVGHRDVPGRPALFGTTRQFLDYFSLKNLDELPPLAEIRDLEDLEPQLDLPQALADGEAPANDDAAIVAMLPEGHEGETVAGDDAGATESNDRDTDGEPAISADEAANEPPDDDADAGDDAAEPSERNESDDAVDSDGAREKSA